MAFTYNLSTDVGLLRLRIPDNEATSYIFEDDELQAYLTRANGSIELALYYIYIALCSISNVSGGDEYRVGDVKVVYAKSRSSNYCAMAKTQLDLIQQGYDTTLLGIGHTSGLYQSDRDENRELKADEFLVDRGFNEDSFTNSDTMIDTENGQAEIED